MKKLLLLFTLMFVAVTAVGCGGEKGMITIWVGEESQEFYTQKLEDYKVLYKENTGDDFPHDFEVLGVDTGSAAGSFLNDPQAGPDIFTSAHDNLGRLIAGSSAVAPVQSPELLAQIENDNPEMFLEVIKGTVDGTEYTFGIPYIAQTLVLYYNTEYVTEEQAQTWEGFLEAAETANKQALSITGTDGYNNSFILLAREAETDETSLQLFEDGSLENTYFMGDDSVAKMKWGQYFFTHPNGAKRPTSSGWESELENEVSLAVISGAWDYEAAAAALGNNLGITVLPTFTIGADQAYGTCEAGTVFQSGSFYDTKAFFMNKVSPELEYLEDILLYITSAEVQEESYEVANNLPAYKNALDEFDALQEDNLEAVLTSAQLRMAEFSISQPFGFSSSFNTFYYQKGAPDLIMEIFENTDGNYTTDEQIIAKMQIIETIWKTGVNETTA